MATQLPSVASPSPRLQHCAPPLLRRRYRWVDFAAAKLPGFRNHLVPVHEVEGLVSRYGPDECYATIFFFSDDILLYMDENLVGGQPSLAGYDGRVWAAFLPFDIDGGPGVAGLEAARLLARATYALLERWWNVPPAALHAYFSGAKGFHLLLDTRVFGRVAPSADLHRVFAHVRLLVRRRLGARANLARFDLAIGDKVRLLRLPNTRHRASQLFKIPLSREELFGCNAEQIRALAQNPRPLVGTTCGGLLPLTVLPTQPLAQAVFRRAQRIVRSRRQHPYRLPKPPADLLAALCPARQAMLAGGVTPGMRNNVAIRLASALRRAGYSREHTQAILLDWNHRLSEALPEREIATVVRSAYARPFPYAYGCHDEVIRQFCPYRDDLLACSIYRSQHARLAGSD